MKAVGVELDFSPFGFVGNDFVSASCVCAMFAQFADLLPLLSSCGYFPSRRHFQLTFFLMTDFFYDSYKLLIS